MARSSRSLSRSPSRRFFAGLFATIPSRLDLIQRRLDLVEDEHVYTNFVARLTVLAELRPGCSYYFQILARLLSMNSVTEGHCEALIETSSKVMDEFLVCRTATKFGIGIQL